MLENGKNYLEVPSTGRSFEIICDLLHLSEKDLRNKIILDIGSGGAGFAHGIHERTRLASQVISLDPKYGDKDSEHGDLFMDRCTRELVNKKMPAVAGV